MRFLIALLAISLFISCKLTKPFVTKSIQNVELAAMGKVAHNSNSFHTGTTLVLKKPVRINITPHVFSKSGFDKLKKQQQYLSQPIVKDDSIKAKDFPNFFRIELTDKVQLVSEIKSEDNIAVNEYLKKSENTVVITSIDVFFSDKNKSVFEKSDDFYLQTIHNKKMVINAYQSGKLIGQIDYLLDPVIAYKAAKFCWGKNAQDKIGIYDILTTGEHCSQGTYENANEFKQKTYDFKDF